MLSTCSIEIQEIKIIAYSPKKYQIIITSKVTQNSTLKKRRLNLLPKPSLTIKHTQKLGLFITERFVTS